MSSQPTKQRRFVIACGGTGGHLFPGLAVAQELKRRGHELLLLISEKEIDALAARGSDSFEFRKLAAIGMPRVFSPAILRFVLRLRESVNQCRRIYAQFQPDAVLGMGGFTSMPPILAAWRSRKSAFIHESNAIPGKANRMAARFASAVFVGFEDCVRHFPGRPCEVTGTPIREALRVLPSKQEALDKFGFHPSRRTVLVAGGSQGAHGVNQLVVRALPFAKKWPVQFIHLTGREDERFVAENYTRAGVLAFIAPFSDCMEMAYAAADAAVLRAGAASLSEVAHAQLPCILIPYPHAAEDHQTRNAEIFERSGAAVLIQERDAAPESLASALERLLNDEVAGGAMRKSLLNLSGGDAAANVATTMLGHLNGNP